MVFLARKGVGAQRALRSVPTGLSSPSADGCCHLNGSGHLGFHCHDVEVHQVIESQVKDVVICTNRGETTLLSALCRGRYTRPSASTTKDGAERNWQSMSYNLLHCPTSICQAGSVRPKTPAQKRKALK